MLVSYKADRFIIFWNTTCRIANSRKHDGWLWWSINRSSFRNSPVFMGSCCTILICCAKLLICPLVTLGIGNILIYYLTGSIWFVFFNKVWICKYSWNLLSSDFFNKISINITGRLPCSCWDERDFHRRAAYLPGRHVNCQKTMFWDLMSFWQIKENWHFKFTLLVLHVYLSVF